MRDIDNSQDTIDSREVLERIEELQGERETEFKIGDDVVTDEDRELLLLLKLQDQAEPYAPDWRYGETLIRDSYFEDYAQELADDCGMIPHDVSWPMTCIDWEQAARELRMDYNAVDFDGVTYWIRG